MFPPELYGRTVNDLLSAVKLGATLTCPVPLHADGAVISMKTARRHPRRASLAVELREGGRRDCDEDHTPAHGASARKRCCDDPHSPTPGSAVQCKHGQGATGPFEDGRVAPIEGGSERGDPRRTSHRAGKGRGVRAIPRAWASRLQRPIEGGIPCECGHGAECDALEPAPCARPRRFGWPLAPLRIALAARRPPVGADPRSFAFGPWLARHAL